MCGHGQQSQQCHQFDVHGGGLAGCRRACRLQEGLRSFSVTIQGTTVAASFALRCVKSSDGREKVSRETESHFL